MLATQGIRGGANRRVLERITESGSIFLAWSDEPWILAGANVHISFVGQDDGSEAARELNGQPVAQINANLTSGIDVTQARRLQENLGIAFLGSQKAGPFDLDDSIARLMLAAPNPDGRSNTDVIRRRANGQSVTRGRGDAGWVIDFGTDRTAREAALYEAPFEYVRAHVEPTRRNNPRRAYRERWWLHAEARPGMRAAIRDLARYIATPPLSKHRLFAWLDSSILPDHQLVVFARDDDYTFGVLQSRVHEVWTRATGTQLREVESGFRYTSSTTFETFPFPRPTDQQRELIVAAAREPVRLRDGWLSPPGLSDGELAERTLTVLYNDKPSWLANANADLDRAVLDAYGWPGTDDEAILGRLLALNLERLPVPKLRTIEA